MKIARKRHGTVTILALAGEFDTDTLPGISRSVDTLIEDGASRFVFNLGALDFIDSSAIGYLIKTRKLLMEQKGEFVISEPSKFFRTTVSALGIDHIIKIFPDDEAALAYFGEP